MKYEILLFCFLPMLLEAQLLRHDIPVERSDGSLYAFPWAGALNNPEFSEIDIDGDGIKDLFVFDKEGDKVLTFKNHGTTDSIDYTHQPEWEVLFPDSLRYFTLLRDYNCDGIEDAFSFYQNLQTGEAGIMLHRAGRTANNLVTFDLVTKALQYNDIGQTSLHNIFLTLIDIPAIDDIDGDGDLDVLAFANGNGYLQWYSNQSVELGYGCDSLLFERQDDCWGRFYESGLGASPSLSPNVDSCFGLAGWQALRTESGVHAGTTLLTLDANNDQVKELVQGNVTYSNLNLMSNTGSADTAFISSLDPNFPSTSLSVDIDFFPAAFYLDINNDNKKDFIASPNNYNLAVNDQVAWLYMNSGATNQPILSFEQSDFLVEDMLEFGTNAAADFVDLNGDGLLDMVVGNYGVFATSSIYRSGLQYWVNTGTTTNPVFSVQNQDLGALQQYNFRRLVPAFGDLDGDGDEDIIIGLNNGELLYVQNTSFNSIPTFATPIPFYDSIDVGQFASPDLVDLDRDGDLDLVVGERNGNLNYYENRGTAQSPDFSSTANSASFGFIDTRLPGALEGSSAPHFWDNNGTFYVFVGSESGEIWTYNNIDGNLTGSFNRISTDFDLIDEGKHSIPAMADITNDGKPELIVGNKRGGLAVFGSDDITSSTATENTSLSCKIYPNPTKEGIFLSVESVVEKDFRLEILDALGRSLKTFRFNSSETHSYIDLSDYAAGLYFIRLNIGNQQVIEKVIRQ